MKCIKAIRVLKGRMKEEAVFLKNVIRRGAEGLREDGGQMVTNPEPGHKDHEVTADDEGLNSNVRALYVYVTENSRFAYTGDHC